MSSRLGLLVLAALVLALPAVLPPFAFTLMNNVGLAALVAIGLVLLTGVGGMTSFGQAAFCGFGAYTTAVLTTAYGLNPWLGLVAALVTTGLAALLLGLVTVRLSGHFLPLGTIAWGISLYYLFGRIDLLGRHDGLSGIPPVSVLGIALTDPAKVYWLIWACVVGAAALTINLLDSRLGRAIRVLRAGQVAPASFGVRVPQVKLIVFVYAALLAGLSGWLYAHTQRAINPTPFGLHAGIEYLFMAVLGGAGQVFGAVLGAGVVTLLKDAVQRLLPWLTESQGQFETIAFGLLLVAILQAAPGGIWGRVAALIPGKPRRVDLAAGVPPRDDAGEPRTELLLAVAGLQKRFGGLLAVDDVGLRVGRREIVALIGPNGAGKTTTFNMITGVLAPTAGDILLEGRPIAGAPAHAIAAAGVARTFQHVKLLPAMSALENVALGAHLHGRAGLVSGMLRLNRAEERRLIGEASRQLDRVRIGAERHQPVGTLALGQQRLVEIARALCLHPKLLLLDEPAAGLRHGEKQALAELLRQLRAEGTGILLVEHDMGFVMNLADHVVVLDFGRKIAEGQPAVVKADPAVVAAYLGAAA